ncbi:MAG: hypothetical protein J6P83_06565 [Bacteroidales bacterium]|nr:hypothetical protein [Bacteroidales bacterium]
MKRLSMILMAGLLVLGLSQCKKENTNNNNEETEGVKITLTVDNGGQKVNVTPGQDYSEVAYTEGDVILVANGGRYVGYLQYSGSAFSGTITESLTTDDKLHFIFVGNKVAPDGLTASTTSITVDMSNQSNGPAVISYASVNYEGGDFVNATVTLLNQASGLVMFTTDFGLTNPITISGSGMYNAMTISFANTPTFTPANTTSNPNEIKLYQTSDAAHKTFLAVIPQNTNAVENVNVITSGYSGTITVPAVYQNMNYYNEGEGVKMILTPDYVFSVSSTQKVHFSPGNLQYQASTNTWRFAENQWDYVGDATNGNVYVNGVKCNNAYISSAYTGWIDLFGWGTSGYSNKYPYMTSENNVDYGDGENNISGTDYDWGVYNHNEIEGGGNYAWRTLTSAEWAYLFNGRSEIGVETRFAKAYLFGSVHGVILFPDNYTHPEGVAAPTGVNETGSTSWNANQYNADDWGKMEDAGCVFLPVTCRRNGSSMYDADYGYYWSSTTNGGYSAYGVYFRNTALLPGNSYGRLRGYSVRLVRDAN